jgi:tetratricopeptide (TPR) repeat protein
MSNDLILTIALLLIPLAISRLLMEKANAALDSETKIKLLDAFAKQRKYRLLIALPVLFLYLFSLKYFPENAASIITIAGILYGCYFVFQSLKNYRIVRSLSVSDAYLKTFKMASLIVFSGFVLLGVQICYLLYVKNEHSGNAAWEMATKAGEEMKRSDYKTAIEDYTQAIEMDPEEATNYLNRGTCYYYSGLKAEAGEDWQQALEMGRKEAEDWLKLLK